MAITAQKNCVEPNIYPFRKGETLRYELKYNWGFIWARAGWVEFNVSDTLFQGKKHMRFRGHGSSFKNWDWFYKVRSAYTSVTDYALNPKYFSRVGIEGSHRYDEHYYRNQETVRMVKRDEKGRSTETKLSVGECSFDVISAIYYCRTIDFKKHKPGTVLPLELYLDGAVHHTTLRYKGIELWEHPDTKKNTRCVVFKPSLLEGTVFKKGENMTVYVTDDEYFTPVFIETELKVGKAKIYLTSR